jgi:hypothetical protein
MDLCDKDTGINDYQIRIKDNITLCQDPNMRKEDSIASLLPATFPR